MLIYLTTQVFHTMSAVMHFTVPYLWAFRAWCPWLTLWPWISWPTCIAMWAFDSRHTRYPRWTHWSWLALWTKVQDISSHLLQKVQDKLLQFNNTHKYSWCP
jgi:hypothetical protein